jgi:hypothetical protein
MRWGFKGWISESDFNNHKKDPATINLETTKVMTNLKLYAYYEQEDCRSTPSSLDFFEFEINNNKRVVNVKEKYWNSLEGSITIPALYENDEK